MIAPSRPCRAIWSRQQSRHLVGIEERHGALHVALVGHGKNTLAVQQPGGIAHRNVAEERSDRGEPGIAAACAVTPRCLGMDEEVRDQIGVDIFDRQLHRRLTVSGTCISQQQPERVAITCDRILACFHLDAQPVGEEALDQRGQGHSAHWPASRLSAVARAIARSSSSGTASRYQYVLDGSLWPR